MNARKKSSSSLPNNKRVCAILDTGAQYGKVVDRRVREQSVEKVIIPIDTSWEKLQHFGAVIIPGGPDDLTAGNTQLCDPRLFTDNTTTPVLGICLGMQLMTQALGGNLERLPTREDGQETITIDTNSPLMTSDRKSVV